jgi:DNA mismatch repair protein MutS2
LPKNGYAERSASMDSAPLADERTLEALDFGAIRGLVARHTATARAAARARALLPDADLARVREEQAATREMRVLATADTFELPRVAEIGESLARTQRGAGLGAEDLRDVGVAVAAADAAIRRVRAAPDAPALAARTRAAEYLPGLAARISDAIGERGEVLDRASPALARVRRRSLAAQDEARERCQSILRSAQFSKAVQDQIVTMREGRFVIPVKAEFSGQVPGVVHDTSASGHTLFVEPLGALEINNRLRTLHIEEEREIARILAELSALVGRHAAQAEINLEILAGIDLSLARVRVAERMDAIAPEIVDEPRVAIFAGRHPLLGERAVPQTFALDDEVRFIVISGPNMGGKTVSLKLLGLFVVMAYCGLQLPAAAGTTIGCFAQLGSDIGDEQSIAENASTFSAHLRRLRTIVSGAGPLSLVLIDEIASGTEPASGAALGIALLEHLLAAGAHGIVTTHATELKLFSHATSGVRNANVRFDAATYAPTYQLDVGSPGQSLAFPLARALGLDVSIVARAESLLSSSERDYDRALAELADIRAQAAAERDALGREREHLETLQNNARRRAEALERERRQLADTAEDRLSRALRDFASELEKRNRERGPARARITSGQSVLLGRVLDDVHRDLGLTPAPDGGKAAPSPALALGDTVAVPSLGAEGQVADDFGETILVAVGAMRTVVSKGEVRLVRRADARADERRARALAGAATLETASAARSELDVRGKRFVEAEPLVEKWLDESHVLGISPLRLIHGKGTGLLGRGLQQYLREHAAVKSVRYGQQDEGGSGVSVVELA